MSEPTTTPISHGATIKLLKAVFSYKRACDELRRADAAGMQPRMQKAGNRLLFARMRMFTAAEECNRAR